MPYPDMIVIELGVALHVVLNCNACAAAVLIVLVPDCRLRTVDVPEMSEFQNLRSPWPLMTPLTPVE